jgi:integrase
LTTERLGLHHFAYLRALIEGLAVPEAAARYLHIDHARAARSAHRVVVERARALARRRGDPAWRLVGIEIRQPSAHATPAQACAGPALPSLDAWAEAQGFDGLRESELLELYTEAFGLAGPTAPAEDHSLRRRRQRAERLRQRQLQALRALEAAAAQPARPDDPVDGWLSPALVQQLVPAGVCTLADLQRRIARGGRWWRGLLHAYGPTKAARLAQHLVLLMGTPAPAGGLVDASPHHPASAATPAWLPTPALPGIPAPIRAPAPMALASVARLLFGPAAPGQDQAQAVVAPVLPAWALGRSSLPSHEAGEASRATVARLAATDDRAAVREWIATRAGSAPTAVRYEREAERFMLWIITERGRALSAATALDCRLYMDHLANIPDAWISRRRVARWAPGWGPFSGPLSLASQAYAVHVLHGLYEWLVQAGYLAGNPWALVNRRKREAVQPERAAHGPSSRAFTPAVWAALRAHLDASPPGPSVERLRWLCTFGEATGLRAAELLHAEVGHLQGTAAGWLLAVVGKGGRARVVPVPHVAMQATRQYLASRGMALTTAPPGTPLLAALDAPMAPITYGALYETFTRFVRRALAASALSPAERDQAAGAAMHWLRHTHATRAAERGVPPDVLQEGLGHSDPRQTAHYYRAQIERRQRAMEGAFGTASPAGP